MTSRIDAEQILWHLDGRIGSLLKTIQSTRVGNALISNRTPEALLTAILREIQLEKFSYQPEITQATASMIDRLPKTARKSLVKLMAAYQAESSITEKKPFAITYSSAATLARGAAPRSSPAAFAVSAVWRSLCREKEPLAHLGALYLLEGLMPLAAGLVKRALEERATDWDRVEFVAFRSSADIPSTRAVRNMIKEALAAYPDPDAPSQMDYGMSCLMHVYPMPVWSAAFDRADEKHARVIDPRWATEG